MNEIREGFTGLHAAWTRVRGDLLDVNVWLALAQPKHPHHQVASEYWKGTSTQFAVANSEQAPEQIERKMHFCRTTMLGMVRLLSHTGQLYGKSVSLKESFALYERFMLLPEVGFVVESASTVDAMMSTMHSTWPDLPPRLSTDLYLAALAQVFQLRLVTFDRDFSRFALPDLLILNN